MSGSGGGYYKYRCKYWLTYNCPHWVWVNNAPCAHCLASGRDDEHIPASQLKMSREVCVPQFEVGNLYYTLMEIVALSDFDCGWVVKEPPRAEFPTSTEPTVANLTATDGPLAQIPKDPGVPTQKDDTESTCR
ncbi:hypothetical protein DSL72_007056 [Monilinia vaccinii-corymbosi]|uniref:Uncharacterized protein n=1 Tax=Monilinia vaccinii-corymbosi TaxID=61207 RepID=A0A8A3PLX0_9HELO|nr:hypothetical protein DSL72_007056 [Monilinia vaccinii-corymbosi]